MRIFAPREDSNSMTHSSTVAGWGGGRPPLPGTAKLIQPTLQLCDRLRNYGYAFAVHDQPPLGG
jgi:hypothetical protein